MAALPDWAARTGKERGAVLRRLFDLMVAHADDLATIITAEMGKPWPEARGEVLYGASYVEWFAEAAKRVYGESPWARLHRSRGGFILWNDHDGCRS